MGFYGSTTGYAMQRARVAVSALLEETSSIASYVRVGVKILACLIKGSKKVECPLTHELHNKTPVTPFEQNCR